jgi:hypothetical protein
MTLHIYIHICMYVYIKANSIIYDTSDTRRIYSIDLPIYRFHAPKIGKLRQALSFHPPFSMYLYVIDFVTITCFKISILLYIYIYIFVFSISYVLIILIDTVIVINVIATHHVLVKTNGNVFARTRVTMALL